MYLKFQLHRYKSAVCWGFGVTVVTGARAERSSFPPHYSPGLPSGSFFVKDVSPRRLVVVWLIQVLVWKQERSKTRPKRRFPKLPRRRFIDWHQTEVTIVFFLWCPWLWPHSHRIIGRAAFVIVPSSPVFSHLENTRTSKTCICPSGWHAFALGMTCIHPSRRNAFVRLDDMHFLI